MAAGVLYFEPADEEAVHLVGDQRQLPLSNLFVIARRQGVRGLQNVVTVNTP